MREIINFHAAGDPFAITLDSEVLYQGSFWVTVSSITCRRVVIMIDENSDSLSKNEMAIVLGYPNESVFIGEDPRSNQKLFQRLIKDNKVKN